MQNSLDTFTVDKILGISDTYDEGKKQTFATVRFKSSDTSTDVNMHVRNFLNQADDINDAWVKLLAFMQATTVNQTNIHYPLFTVTKCKIEDKWFSSVIVSRDLHHQRGYGLIAFEFDDEKNVTVADPHDAHKRDIAIFVASINAAVRHAKAGTDDVKRAAQINRTPTTPKSIDQARLLPEWVHWEGAIQNESHGMFSKRNALHPTQTSELTSDQMNRACKLTWVFKIKMKNGEVAGYRARLCAQGFSQIFGENYNKTHAPVANYTTFLAALELSVQLGLHKRHFDAEKAYLNATLPEPLLCKFANGQEVDGCQFCWATHCIYGLKQAGHHWAKLSHENIMRGEPRLTRSSTDSCLYYYHSDELTIIIVTNVDDYAVFCSDENWYDGFAKRYSESGTILTCEGEIERWCGQDIKHYEDGSLSLSQEHDVLATIADMDGIADMRPVDSPMETNFHHVAATPPTPSNVNDLHGLDLAYPYRKAIGSALWFARRNFPETLSATTILAAYTAKPTRYHVRAVKRLFKYLHGVAQQKIYFTRNPRFDKNNIQLDMFTDADWAAERTSRRSMSGYCAFMNGNLVSAACKYHPTQCLSTMEAEYMGEVYACKEMIFLQNLLTELYGIALPIPMFGDNVAALKFAEEQGINNRTKHIDLRHHFIKSYVDEGVITMNYVCTLDNIADILTKPLKILDFEKFKKFFFQMDKSDYYKLIAKLKHLNELRHKEL
jgi:hypothetical protein